MFFSHLIKNFGGGGLALGGWGWGGGGSGYPSPGGGGSGYPSPGIAGPSLFTLGPTLSLFMQSPVICDRCSFQGSLPLQRADWLVVIGC